jgi:hypothetical protein
VCVDRDGKRVNALFVNRYIRNSENHIYRRDQSHLDVNLQLYNSPTL